MSASVLFARFRTLLLVTVVTCIVWLLAESRMVQTRAVPLRLVVAGQPSVDDSALVVRPDPDGLWASNIEVELEGSLASLDASTRELRGLFTLLVGEHIPGSPGVHEVDLRTALRSHPALRRHGVSVRSVSPDMVRVEVDELVTLELPVDVRVPEGTRLEAPARTSPETVRVTTPGSLVPRFENGTGIARVSPGTVATLTPGAFQTIPSVPVDLPVTGDGLTGSWVPRAEPARVEVRLTLRSRSATARVERLPVQVLLAPGEIGRWSVTLTPGEEDLLGVRFEGPSDALELIRGGGSGISAALTLTYQELERGITSKRPRVLGLPEGVSVRSEIPEVSFEIRRIEVPAADPGGGG